MSPSSVQISALSEYAFVFYGRLCEVCEMKKMKKKNTKKLKRNFVRSYLENGWSDFLQIWYVDSPNWEIWFQSDKGLQSYIGVKIAFYFFLFIYSRCGAPTSWAARHTTVCLDTTYIMVFEIYTKRYTYLGKGAIVRVRLPLWYPFLNMYIFWYIFRIP